MTTERFALTTTKGLSQIVTPHLRQEGELSLSLQIRRDPCRITKTKRFSVPYDFNETWRVQVDWQSGSENSSAIGFTCNVTRAFQFNPALYASNGSNHDLCGYIVFTYTFPALEPEKEIGRLS